MGSYQSSDMGDSGDGQWMMRRLPNGKPAPWIRELEKKKRNSSSGKVVFVKRTVMANSQLDK